MIGLYANCCLATERIQIVTNDYEPFVSSNPEKPGFILEVVKKLFELANIPLEVKFYPWRRCEKLVEAGEVFAALPYFKNEDRVNRFEFSRPLANSVNRFFYSVDRFPEGFSWSSLNSFIDKKIAAVSGYWYIKSFKRAGISMVMVNSDEQSIAMLLKGRADFSLMDEMTALIIIKKNHNQFLNKIKYVERPESVEKFFLMVSRKYDGQKEILKHFNKGLIGLKKNGRYINIMHKYDVPKYYYSDLLVF